MSVTLLPSSPMAYGQTLTPLLTPSATPAKRPKLSLNTSGVAPIYGKRSTSLRLETLSATSPTTTNTFRNAQDLGKALGDRTRRPALVPVTTDNTTLSTETLPSSRNDSLDASDAFDDETSSTVSTTSTSSIESSPSEAPYKLPFNAVSILKNGPGERNRCRTTSFAQSRPMFPTPKKVAFRTQLTEEIMTSKYTLRHSDIDDPTSLRLKMPEPEESRKEDDVVREKNEDQEMTNDTTLPYPHAGEKRESSDEEDNDDDTCPATPIAGRRKRHRQWQWTLGPINSEQSKDVDDPV